MVEACALLLLEAPPPAGSSRRKPLQRPSNLAAASGALCRALCGLDSRSRGHSLAEALPLTAVAAVFCNLGPQTAAAAQELQPEEENPPGDAEGDQGDLKAHFQHADSTRQLVSRLQREVKHLIARTAIAKV